MKCDNPETLDIKKCLQDLGFDYKFYINSAKHLADTVEEELEYFPLIRFEEDLANILDMIRVCTKNHNTVHKRYTYLLERLKRDRYKKDRK